MTGLGCVHDGSLVTVLVYFSERLPVSEPLGADPDSLRVRRFSHKSHIQTAASRCATAAREPPNREAWRTPLDK